MESKSKRLTIDEQMDKFLQIMENEGEMFFSTGNTEQDFNLVKSTINNQGYWAGVGQRYYFDDDMNIMEIQERKFGS